MLEQEALPQQAARIIGYPAELRLQGLLRLGRLRRLGRSWDGRDARRRRLVRPLAIQQVRNPGLGAGPLVWTRVRRRPAILIGRGLPRRPGFGSRLVNLISRGVLPGLISYRLLRGLPL